MEGILFKELQKGLEDIIGKFNNELNPLEKLGKREYQLRTGDNTLAIYRTSCLSRKGHRKIMMDIELHGSIIVAMLQSPDWRLGTIKNYLQTFSDKYEGKGVMLKYEEFTPPTAIPQTMYPYDSI